MAFEISEDHQSIIRNMLKIPESAEIPAAVVDEYYTTLCAAERVQHYFDTGDILAIVRRAVAKTPPPDEPSALDLALQGKLAHGDPVEVTWKFGRSYPGVFKGIQGRDLVVQIDDDPSAEERIFPPEKVKVK